MSNSKDFYVYSKFWPCPHVTFHLRQVQWAWCSVLNTLSKPRDFELYSKDLVQTLLVLLRHVPFIFALIHKPKMHWILQGRFDDLLLSFIFLICFFFFLTFSSLVQADSPIVHILSASCAGFASASATNPIWFIKTRLQLDTSTNVQQQMTVRECIQRIYTTSGFRGFYKGITASYFGISETVIHFVIYEAIKKRLIEMRQHQPELNRNKTSRDFVEFMAAGAVSKTIASCVAYPHEVARTRLREEGNKYKTFCQTLLTVWKEEGKSGLYRYCFSTSSKALSYIIDFFFAEDFLFN